MYFKAGHIDTHSRTSIWICMFKLCIYSYESAKGTLSYIHVHIDKHICLSDLQIFAHVCMFLFIWRMWGLYNYTAMNCVYDAILCKWFWVLNCERNLPIIFCAQCEISFRKVQHTKPPCMFTMKGEYWTILEQHAWGIYCIGVSFIHVDLYIRL